jgi:hypothetical protein
MRAAHHAGEVIPEKFPRALMIEEDVCNDPSPSIKGDENFIR